MLGYAQIALTMLKIASALIDWAKAKGQYDAGQDAQIAKATAELLVKTQSAKAIMQNMTGMTEEQVDATLKGLEP